MKMGKKLTNKYFRNLDEDALKEFKKKKNDFNIKSLDHSKINYEKIKKSFYFENKEIAEMSYATVEDIR